ncbi:MAG TPA: choice-of-anchor Q domain-containing protein, partial [Anaerolineae bacterium]|nr:choice-of-anchor Q domain-containing protein [Anaerolineae bacterium]
MNKQAHLPTITGKHYLIITLTFIIFALLLTLHILPATATPQNTPSAVILVNTTADTLTPGDGICTLREAINNANQNIDTTANDCPAGTLGLDTIILTVGGAYQLNIPGPSEDGNLNGDLDIWENTDILANAPSPILINANTLDRIFHIDPNKTGIEVNLNGFALANGRAPAGEPGGAIWNTDFASLQLNNMRIGSTFAPPNQADWGGGIMNNGTLNIIDTIIENNRAITTNGGGIYNAGFTAIFGGNISFNNANSQGGGIYSPGPISLNNNLHIMNNIASGPGGGLNLINNSTIDNTNINNNQSISSVGGGIFITNTARLDLTNSFILTNTAIAGAGIYNLNGQLQITTTNIISNSANVGAGLASNGPFTMVSSFVSRNKTTTNNGGGILIENGTAVINNSTLANNKTTNGNGGAIAIRNTGSLALNSSTIHNNISANDGAGIWSRGRIELYNSTLSGNRAANAGGAIWADNIPPTINNSSILNNIANIIGGGLASNIPAELKNSLVALNGNGDCAFAPPNSLGHNLDSDASCALAAPGDASGLNPNVSPLQNNGGDTLTHALLAPSPAINTADPSCLDSFGNPITTDQRGLNRPQGAACDKGAYEAANTPPNAVDENYSLAANTIYNSAPATVLDNDFDPDGDPLTTSLLTPPTNGTLTFNLNGTFIYTPTPTFVGTDSFTYIASDGTLTATATAKLNVIGNIIVDTPDDIIDANGGDCLLILPTDLPGPDSFTSLREAICAANNNPGLDSIILTPDYYALNLTGFGEDNNETGDLDILDHLLIDGIDQNNTIIDGLNDDRVFHILPTITVDMHNMTLINGTASGTIGGGIFNAGNLHLTNAFLVNNEADSGGGIANTGNLTLTQTILENNGAIVGGGIASNNARLTLLNTSILDNQALGDGGGVWYNTGRLTLRNSTIAYNQSNNDGGGLWIRGNTALFNSTISLNTAPSEGGGLWLDPTPANITINNSTIVSNTASTGGGIMDYIPFNYKNSIIGLNTGGDCATGIGISSGYNIDTDASCNLAYPLNDITASPNVMRLGPLQNNGGDTLTHALQGGSIAVDNADPACTTINGNPINRDQRGQPRPLDGRGDNNFICDRGAYERENNFPPIANPDTYTTTED